MSYTGIAFRCMVLVLALVFASPSLADRDVGLGIVLGWTASTGGPEGYDVLVSRDGGPFLVEKQTPAPQVGLGGTDGQRVQVKVRAYRGAVQSLESPLSEVFTFHAPPPGAPTRPTIDLDCSWGAPITTSTGPTTVRIECPPQE